MAVVCITGATSGIGYELAKIFAKEKRDLFLVARDEEKLISIKEVFEKDYGIYVHYLAKDLSLAYGPEEVDSWLQRENPEVDVFINNAGFGQFGEFRENDLKREESMIMLNVLALTKLSKYVLKFMKKGYILNVASTAAFEPGPYMAVYFATKAYVLSFSEALAEELRGSDVYVSTLCPGPTKTQFEKVAEASEAGIFKSTMSAETVATYAYKHMMKGKRIIIPGIQNKFLIFVIRFIPRGVVTWMVGKIMKS